MPRQHDITSALGYLAIVTLVCGGYCITLAAAEQLPWTLGPVAPLLLVLSANSIYLGLHELKHYGRITDARCKSLIDTVHAWSFVPNYFDPHPPATRAWQENVLVAVVGVVVQFLLGA
eukprot:g6857.t1